MTRTLTLNRITVLLLIGFLLASTIVLMQFGYIWSTPGTHSGMGTPGMPRPDCGNNYTLWFFCQGSWSAKGNLTQDELNTIIQDEGQDVTDPGAIEQVLKVFERIWLKR